MICSLPVSLLLGTARGLQRLCGLVQVRSLLAGAGAVVAPAVGAVLLLHAGNGPLPIGGGSAGDGGMLYVANLRSSDVSIVDLARGKEVGRFAVADNPHELLHAGDNVWVSNYHSAAVTRLGPSGDGAGALSVSGEPHGLAEVAGMVAVTQGSAGEVALLDRTSGALVTEVPVGGEPHMAASAGGLLYVVDAANDQLVEIDPRVGIVTRRTAVGHVPESLSVSPDGHTIAVANARSRNLSVVDRASLTERARVPLAGAPVRVLYSRDGRTLAVSLNDAGQVLFLNTADNSVRSRVPVGLLPDGLAQSADGKTLYVALSGDHRLVTLRLSDHRVTGSINVGDGPSGLLLTGGRGLP